MSRIAVIGAGNVGGALGKRFREAGHTVVWGVPEPTNPKYEGLATATVANATLDAEFVVFAVPWGAARAAIDSAENLVGKIVIDAMNPIADDFSDLVPLGGISAAEHVAKWTPGATVVKAFNTVGSNIMENPQFGSVRATMLIASDDAEAKAAVLALAEQIGFAPVDAGPLSMARHLESFAWVWITLAAKLGHGREMVFELLKREP